jgi:hypothetical protein
MGPGKGPQVDLPEPPRIVFEQPSPCADEARAIALLERTLAPTQAPSGAWTVTMRVENTAGALVAGAEVTDDRGGPVAHRSFTRTGDHECAALARAVGVWASVVLDGEVERVRSQPAERVPATPPTVPLVAPPDAPPPAEKPTPTEVPTRRLEVGASTFVMGGVASEAFAGALLFTSVEVGDNVFLRPALAFGRTMESISPSDVYGTWGTGRFDTCTRAPGYYREGIGLAVDLCAGTELGFLHFDTPSSAPFGTGGAQPPRTTPFMALGPAVGIRGDLGGGLVAELRGVVGLNVIREQFADSTGIVQDPPLLSGRGELGLSWRVR